MKPFSLPIAAATVASLFLPLSALAHQQEVFKIGDKTYSFEIGSLNEPVIVDDKSGVELGVSLFTEGEEEEHEHEVDPNAVTGLEKTLKVEIIAGEKKKTRDLSPIFGEAGSYKAVFMPTVATTLTYRLFGTINDVSVDLSFTCNPAGHPQAEEDTSEVPMGAKVTRILKTGAFGCPRPKEDIGFPEPATALYTLSESTKKAGMDWGMIGAVLGGLGLLAGIGAWMKKS